MVDPFEKDPERPGIMAIARLISEEVLAPMAESRERYSVGMLKKLPEADVRTDEVGIIGVELSVSP